MRRFLLLLLAAVSSTALAQTPACTGLCLQQIQCSPGQTTSISGTVYSPNGVDPLPNVLVFIPNATVDAMTPGVSCPVPGQGPSGTPLVGTSTAADGTFTISNVPVGTNIPLVIQSGRWRRQVIVPTTTACADSAFSTRMPRNQAEGDIPLIAIATGSADSVECALRKVGIDDAEFTNPISTGRIHLYTGAFSRGAQIDANTPTQDVLANNPAELAKYDVLMLPCQSGAAFQSAAALANFVSYANAGGRVYASHFSYVWMANNPPFNTVANWAPNQPYPFGTGTGTGSVNPAFGGGKTLTTWLQTVGATTTPGQIGLSVTRHDMNGVVAPTQAWITLNDPADGNPVMQMTFNTPVGTTGNQCGRILFDEYHVENPVISPTGKNFPAECNTAPMTSQEKLLEYSLFDLTNDGGVPMLIPSTADFGPEPLGFTSNPTNYTWTNNSIFTASVTSATTTGDFVVTGNNCVNIPTGGTCQISAAFRPTVLGAATGILTVVSNARTITATLTGTGTPALISSTTSLAFGLVDVGAQASQTITITNTAPAAIALPAVTVSGDYTIKNNCGAALAAGAGCVLQVVFQPSATGTRAGSIAFAGGSGLPGITLSGTGVDFTVALAPTSGAVIAGTGVAVPASLLPVSGYAAAVTITCTTNAPGSTCLSNLASGVPSSTLGAQIAISTTSKFTVLGYAGFGHPRSLWLLLLSLFGTSALVWQRKRLGRFASPALLVLTLCTTSLVAGGCSGKLPAQNPVYTAPGSYTYTLTATDGFLTHSATYTLNVTAQ